MGLLKDTATPESLSRFDSLLESAQQNFGSRENVLRVMNPVQNGCLVMCLRLSLYGEVTKLYRVNKKSSMTSVEILYG